MTKAPAPKALAIRLTADAGFEAARMFVIYGCAAALVFAGLIRF